MKMKYYSLSKEEKKKLQEEFLKTEFGISLNKRLKRLLITGIVSFLFSIVLFIFHTTTWDIVTGILLLIASLVFIIGSFKVKDMKLNDYLVKKKKK